MSIQCNVCVNAINKYNINVYSVSMSLNILMCVNNINILILMCINKY